MFWFISVSGKMLSLKQLGKRLLLRNMNLSQFSRLIVLVLFIGLFFSFMARIDFVVNATLYDYGLVFSYNWAIPYWTTYYTIFMVFSLIVGFIYWVGSLKAVYDMKVAVALFATINSLAISGLQDVLYFIFWAGGLPPNNVVWWWSHWISVFGTWNSVMQVALTVIAIAISTSIWALALYQKKKT